jgi:hypothetical protein
VEGIGLARLVKYMYLLQALNKLLRKDFEKANVQDVKRVVSEVNKSEYADWTKNDLRVTLKRFYRWLRKLPDDQDPPETSWIKIQNTNGKQVLPEELLVDADIQKMHQVCQNSRERAFEARRLQDATRVRNVLDRFYSRIVQRGLSERTCLQYFSVMRGFFLANRIPVGRRRKPTPPTPLQILFRREG